MHLQIEHGHENNFQQHATMSSVNRLNDTKTIMVLTTRGGFEKLENRQKKDLSSRILPEMEKVIVHSHMWRLKFLRSFCTGLCNWLNYNILATIKT